MSHQVKRSENETFKTAERSRRSRAKVPRWKALRLAIYDPSTKKFLGRTKSSWGVVGLFYLVFFTVLVILCAICYKGLMLSIDLKRPSYILEDSLIGTSPGLGFRPISDDINQGSLVWYNTSNSSDVKTWKKRIDKFLDVYVNSSLLPTRGKNQRFCTNIQPVSAKTVCAFDVTGWGDCSPGGNYGYDNSTPCFFIKLNKIYGWVPSYYNGNKPLPLDMPPNIRDKIKSTNLSNLNVVWVSCQGQNPADREMIGDIKYYPTHHGFLGYYFPFTNTPGYLSPLVAVQFSSSKKNVIINVECRAWAENIRYSGRTQNREGSVHFAFMIDI
ncbi:sodium/potassium-transporting ATPase subunit beta-2-like isoform X1 [Neodiprion fabricii]|uniref:sodium/potassium-transporting ATPase subunit beta-2-like isoform X1 n=1 Tax=Neodiprion fabricii TaxID=2872261 RepID=UPI001ED8E13A|nr:sodium/potassium-transporting ATPase subunit beta-2-like isoform X1 [Neodiprion fabricii]